mmetsp:Transcript_58/g.211  ORF Transcript_58/g.211 Transcript_58/m.211 type:complete len:234 (+) Transcript_58:713-1414(+)
MRRRRGSGCGSRARTSSAKGARTSGSPSPARARRAAPRCHRRGRLCIAEVAAWTHDRRTRWWAPPQRSTHGRVDASRSRRPQQTPRHRRHSSACASGRWSHPRPLAIPSSERLRSNANAAPQGARGPLRRRIRNSCTVSKRSGRRRRPVRRVLHRTRTLERPRPRLTCSGVARCRCAPEAPRASLRPSGRWGLRCRWPKLVFRRATRCRYRRRRPSSSALRAGRRLGRCATSV